MASIHAVVKAVCMRRHVVVGRPVGTLWLGRHPIVCLPYPFRSLPFHSSLLHLPYCNSTYSTDFFLCRPDAMLIPALPPTVRL